MQRQTSAPVPALLTVERLRKPGNELGTFMHRLITQYASMMMTTMMRTMMMMITSCLTRHALVTVLATLWTLANLQYQALADCARSTPPIIPDDQLRSLRYSVVIDAGSSGSRIHVYQWREVEGGLRPRLPKFEHIFCKKTTPGVSECRSNSEIESHVLALVEAATPYVPEKVRSETPISFLATAGMRMLPENKANNATKYIDELLSNATRSPFLYRSPDNARVLSGEEEGVYAWIAANYLDDVFTPTGTKRTKYTRGILELGGASTQIAFVPMGNIFDNKYPVTVAGVRYSLYVHSYLIYGQDQVDAWIREKIVQEEDTIARKQQTADNPCMLKGDSIAKIVNGTNITFIGRGDPARCLKLLDQMIYQPLEPWRCNPKPCAIGPTYQPSIHPNKTFHLMGAFLYPLKSMNVTRPDGSFSLLDLTNAAKEYCSTPRDELIKRGHTTKPHLLSRECLTGLYMPILFQKAYRFSNATRQLRAPVEPSSNDIEWALGAVIYEYENRRCFVQCATVQCFSTRGSGSASIHTTSAFRIGSRSIIIACLLVLTIAPGFNSLSRSVKLV